MMFGDREGIMIYIDQPKIEELKINCNNLVKLIKMCYK